LVSSFLACAKALNFSSEIFIDVRVHLNGINRNDRREQVFAPATPLT